ncbi:MAG: hypothetical protein GX160_02065 [Clostridiales bacterium]|nr:hypothetical protein [Clostridiales bacterium]
MILLIVWVVVLVIVAVVTNYNIEIKNKGLAIMNNKHFKAGVIGFSFAIIGSLLRLFAQDIAWPLEYGYSGPREETIWAIREQAYKDIGLTFLIFGLAVLLVTIINWLWSSFPNREE